MMTPTVEADLPQADDHRADPVEHARPRAKNDPQVRSALPVRALHASMRYFSDIVQAQEERLAARQREIDSLAGELSQRRAEVDERNARLAGMADELRHERAVHEAEIARLTHALAEPPRVRTLLRHWLRPLRPVVRWVPRVTATAAAGAAAPPARTDAPEQRPAEPLPAVAACVPDEHERMRPLVTEGRFLELQRVAILTPSTLREAGTAIGRCLAHAGLQGTVYTELPEDFAEDLCIVVNPFAFSRLPPADRSIMWLAGPEETAAALEDRALACLSSSLAIFDASLERIQMLQGRGIALHQIFYVPLDPLDTAEACAAALADPSPLGLRYLLARALHGCGAIGYEAFERATRDVRLDADRVVLCMPESLDRFRNAQAGTCHGAVLFPGIRRMAGWHGTALSYRHLAQAAQAAGRTRLIVWEDDVAFPADFEDRLDSVLAYLDAHEGCWDLFSGLLTDLSEQAQVQGMDVHEDNLFVRTDTVIGMVFGIYGRQGLQMLAAYRLEEDDTMKYSIDRYLEALRPRCCTVFPPLVRHDDAFSSTLWRHEDRRFVTNEFMNPMIQRSQRRLVSKMIGYLERRTA